MKNSKFKVVVFSLLAGMLLSGCGSQTNFDASGDIAAIQDAVKVFQDLSDSAHSNDSVENMERVAELNHEA